MQTAPYGYPQETRTYQKGPTMPAMQHVYLTAHGAIQSGHYAGETAQIGVRLAIADTTAEPAKGTTFAIATNGDVAVDSGTTAGTNGTLTRTWTARLGPIGSTNNADDAWQIDLAEDMRTFLLALQGYQSNKFAWTHVKIAPILADGKYGAPAALYQLTSAIAGTSSSPQPPEVACAVTFRAPVIGRRGRGRMYIPAISAGSTVLDGDGCVGSTFSTALKNAAVTLVSNLENAPGTEDWGPILMVTSAGSSTGVRPSQVRVGNHFDVQRRRQSQVNETYSSTNL